MDQAYGRQSHIDQHFRSFQDGGFPVLLHETKRDAPDAYTSTATLVDAPMARSRGEKMPKLIIPDGNFAQPGSAGGSPTKGPAVPLPNFLHTLKKRMPRLPLIPNNDPMQLTQMLQEFEFREQMRVCMIQVRSFADSFACQAKLIVRFQAALKWAEEDFDGLQFMSKPDQVLERLWHHLPVEGRNICTAVLTPDSTLLATWLTEVARYHLPLSRWLEFRFPGTGAFPMVFTGFQDRLANSLHHSFYSCS